MNITIRNSHAAQTALICTAVALVWLAWASRELLPLLLDRPGVTPVSVAVMGVAALLLSVVGLWRLSKLRRIDVALQADSDGLLLDTARGRVHVPWTAVSSVRPGRAEMFMRCVVVQLRSDLKPDSPGVVLSRRSLPWCWMRRPYRFSPVTTDVSVPDALANLGLLLEQRWNAAAQPYAPHS